MSRNGAELTSSCGRSPILTSPNAHLERLELQRYYPKTRLYPKRGCYVYGLGGFERGLSVFERSGAKGSQCAECGSHARHGLGVSLATNYTSTLPSLRPLHVHRAHPAFRPASVAPFGIF